MKERRVVVTGMGAVSPVGNTVADAWQSILACKSGIGVLDEFDTTDFSAKIVGLVKDFDPTEHGISAKDSRKMDVFIHYAIAAANQAIKDSGLEVTVANAHRIGVCIGSGIGGIPQIEQNAITLDKNGPKRVSPFFIPSTIINMASGHVSIMHGLKGPNLSTVSACTTGMHGIAMGQRMIAYGDADVMIVGGAEKSSSPLGIGGFAAMRALSTRNDDPERASRPWDKSRDGFVLSNGAGVLVLETYEHAKSRGAHIYGELAGAGMSGDAYHMTKPSSEGAKLAMQNALHDAKMNPSDIDYINAHATSTSVGDMSEYAAVKSVLGSHSANVAMSSTKSMTGHLLGAAGALEAIFTLLALRDQVLPPTINLDNPEDDIDMDLVPNKPKEKAINVAISNSFGFGGSNGTLIFKRI